MTPRGFRSGLVAASLVASVGLFAVVFFLASAPDGVGPPPVEPAPEIAVNTIVRPPVEVAPAPPAVEPAPEAAKPKPVEPAKPKPPEPVAPADDLAARAVALALRPGLPPAPVVRAADARKPLAGAGQDLPLPAARVPVAAARPVVTPPANRATAARPKLLPEPIPAGVGGALNPGDYPLSPREVPPWRRPPAVDPLAPPAVPSAPKAGPAQAFDPVPDHVTPLTVFTPLLPVFVTQMAARFDLPDPFEYVAHLRAAPLAAAPELAASPEPVPPTLPVKP